MRLGESSMALDWDVLNEDCADISDWTNADGAGCTSSQVTFDSKSCFKLSSPAAAADNNRARIYRGITLPDTCSIEIAYHIADTNQGSDLYISLYTTGGHRYVIGLKTYYITFLLASGAWYYYYAGPAALGYWRTVRIVIKASRKVDAWLYNDRWQNIFADVTGDRTFATTNRFELYNVSDNTDPSTTYTNYVKVDTTPEAPTTTGYLKIHDQEMCIQPPGFGVYNGIDSLLMYAHTMHGTPAVRGVPIVATANTNASKVRIYDGTSVKALMKLPS